MADPPPRGLAWERLAPQAVWTVSGTSTAALQAASIARAAWARGGRPARCSDAALSAPRIQLNPYIKMY